MSIQSKEEQDLINNSIFPNTGARMLYETFRKHGQSHTDAVIETITGINNIKSSTLSEVEVGVVKRALVYIKGKDSYDK